MKTGDGLMETLSFNQNQGLDHVALCVRSLSEAQSTFQKMGFQAYPGGKHADFGTQNSGAWFANDTYVELLTYFDPIKAGWLADFLDQQEGAFFLVLRVSSVEETASLLRQRGVEINEPIPGTWQQDDDCDHSILWYSLFLPRTNLPGKLLFFIEYTDQEESSRGHSTHPVHFATHPNSSTQLQSVWVAVDDLEKAAKEFEDLGFRVGPTENFAKMQALKRVIHVGRGKIELIQPIDDESPVAEFLKSRGEGIFGFSIGVENISTAQAQLSEAILQTVQSDDKQHYLWLPPSVCHGAWIEFKQLRPPLSPC